QYAHDLAQDLVRIVGEFQDVRKHDEVDAVRGNREVPEVGLEGDRTGGTQGPARGDTGGTQQIDLREPVLQCVVAEDVGHHAVVVVAFALEHVLAERGIEPGSERLGGRLRRLHA